MQCQMIRSGKSSFTKATLKRPMACMFSVMPCKFVRSGKFPTAAFPATNIRLFTRMSPVVSLQMAWLCIGFQTSVIGTCMNSHFFLAPFSSATFFWWNSCSCRSTFQIEMCCLWQNQQTFYTNAAWKFKNHLDNSRWVSGLNLAIFSPVVHKKCLQR